MALAGLATVVLWSGGITSRWFRVVVVLWVALWVWRFFTKGWRLWGPVAALLTVVAVTSGVPHVAERLARGCTTELAIEMLGHQPNVAGNAAD